MLHEKLCYNLITKQVNVREEWNGKMALICKYGTKECSFCGSCFHRGESKTEAQCSVCGRMFFTGNPGGVGHTWFRRLFIKKLYQKGERKEDYEFIPATVDDNKILMLRNPEYVTVLDSLPEKLRRAHRYGERQLHRLQPPR